MDMENTSRTAGEAGWRLSRYNLAAVVPDKDQIVIANLMRGNCAVYSPLEYALLNCVEELEENHPILPLFVRRGLIVNYDELAAINSLGRAACFRPGAVSLTLCPTIGCNFDCPYCFEEHRPGKMSPEVQDAVIRLTKRLLEFSAARSLHITWFGGEPLLAKDVIKCLSEKLIRLAEENGAKYTATVVTNGYLLDQQTADLLGEARVTRAQITLDGIGSAHDATRHLAGGGPTFDRIVSNLRHGKLPFSVSIRHNVHDKNRAEMEPLARFVKELSSESGNRISYYPSPVQGNQMSEDRHGRLELLCGSDDSEVGIAKDARLFRAGRGVYCGAGSLFCAAVDDQGRLYKCWEDVDKPEHSFGQIQTWDPVNPLFTASQADQLTGYLNASCPLDDEECMDCIWLPACAGGCPNQRIHSGKKCLPYKDDPEKYVLALYRRIKKKKLKQENEEKLQEPEGKERKHENTDTAGAV